jgi:hypothetical protein
VRKTGTTKENTVVPESRYSGGAERLRNMTTKKRDYRSEYLNYDGTEVIKKRRAIRNAARAKMMKLGKVHKGDGKDVDHITPLRGGGTSAKSNLRMRSVKANRGDNK